MNLTKSAVRTGFLVHKEERPRGLGLMCLTYLKTLFLLDVSFFILYLNFCYRKQLPRLQQQQILKIEILAHQSPTTYNSSNITTNQTTPIPAWRLILILVFCCSLLISTLQNKLAECVLCDIFQMYIEKTIKQSKHTNSYLTECKE